MIKDIFESGFEHDQINLAISKLLLNMFTSDF